MLKKLDKKVWLILGIVGGLIIILLLVALFINIFGKERLDYAGLEQKMVESAKSYYESNNNFLPQIEGNSVDVSLSSLVSDGYMKEPSEYLNDETLSCSGKVTVIKNKSDYGYYPFLDCGDKHKTTYLNDEIKKNVVTSSAGVYEMKQTLVNKHGEKSLSSFYVYKGENVNNYIVFNDFKWRIVKSDSDGNITIIFADKDPDYLLDSVWDDRYNVNTQGTDGINDYNVSRAKENINKIFDSNFFSDDFKSKLIKKDVCIGSRSDSDNVNNGSIECSKVLKDQYFSLLPAYDYINASLDSSCIKLNDPQCSNYNYLNTHSKSWWMITSDRNTTDRVYKVSNNVSKTMASGDGQLRIVSVLNSKTILSGGTGSFDDPYIIK